MVRRGGRRRRGLRHILFRPGRQSPPHRSQDHERLRPHSVFHFAQRVQRRKGDPCAVEDLPGSFVRKWTSRLYYRPSIGNEPQALDGDLAGVILTADETREQSGKETRMRLFSFSSQRRPCRTSFGIGTRSRGETAGRQHEAACFAGANRGDLRARRFSRTARVGSGAVWF